MPVMYVGDSMCVPALIIVLSVYAASEMDRAEVP